MIPGQTVSVWWEEMLDRLWSRYCCWCIGGRQLSGNAAFPSSLRKPCRVIDTRMKEVETWTWITSVGKETEGTDRAERSGPDVLPRGWMSLGIFSLGMTEVCKITYGVERRNGKGLLALVCWCLEEAVRRKASNYARQACSPHKWVPLTTGRGGMLRVLGT